MGRPATCDCGECRKCKHRIYMRKWYASRPGYAAASVRARRADPVRGEELRAYDRDRYHNDPETRKKHDARQMVHARVGSGTMTKLPCEVCGDPNSEAHHPDYDKPLDVVWLCAKHHAEVHA